MSFQFPKLVPFVFTWLITDASTPAVPIVDCQTVVATLYAGRSATNPDLVPGTPVPTFNNVALSSFGDGNYSADIGDDGDFNPTASDNYRVVIVATDVNGDPLGHWEESASVVVNE